MEQFLQGGWYRIGHTADSCTDVHKLFYPMDTATTIEVFFFSGHTCKQYYWNDKHIELFNWKFLADDTNLYRYSKSTSKTNYFLVRGDTLLIKANFNYNWYCRYKLTLLPGSWPDSIVDMTDSIH